MLIGILLLITIAAPCGAVLVSDDGLLITLSSALKLHSNLSSTNGSFVLLIGDNEHNKNSSSSSEQLVDSIINISVIKTNPKFHSAVATCRVPLTAKTNGGSENARKEALISWSWNGNALWCAKHYLPDGALDFEIEVAVSNDSTLDMLDYYVGFNISRRRCIKDFRVCDTPLKNLSDTCHAEDTATLASVASQSLATCMYRIDYDPRCCQACLDENCPDNNNNSVVEPAVVFPTPAPFFPTPALFISEKEAGSDSGNASTNVVSQDDNERNSTDNSSKNEVASTSSDDEENKTNTTEKTVNNGTTLALNSNSNISLSDNKATILTVSNTTTETNPCASDPCPLNSYCVAATTTENSPDHQRYTCNCRAPYSGPNCTHVDYCNNKYFTVSCLNGATCLVSNQTRVVQSTTKNYTCICTTNFTGDFCDIPKAASNGTVMLLLPVETLPSKPDEKTVNGTTTQETPIETSTTPSLTVPLSNPCEPNPCEHNGTCTPAAANNASTNQEQKLVLYKCLCAPLWNGSDDCSVASAPILQQTNTTGSNATNITGLVVPDHVIVVQTEQQTTGGGLPTTTVSTTNESTSAALVTTTAVEQIITPTTVPVVDCRSNASLCSHGYCGANGRCNCSQTGYEGAYCELDVDECRLSLCHNNSECVNNEGSFTCACPAGFQGPTCDVPLIPFGAKPKVKQPPKPDEPSSSKAGAIVGGIFGAIAIVCLVIGSYFLYKYITRSRKLRGKYNPAKEEMNSVGGHPVPLATLHTGERLI